MVALILRLFQLIDPYHHRAPIQVQAWLSTGELDNPSTSQRGILPRTDSRQGTVVRTFLTSWLGWIRLGYQIVKAIPAAGWQAMPRRLMLLLPAWCLFGLLNTLHWIGFVLDEIFFRGYRDVTVQRPIHVVGVPRSGTTHLHRILAHDRAFTSFTLIECVLAPSITEKYLWLGPARLLRKIWPLRATGRNKDNGGLLPGMASIHKIGLNEPEEDFVILLWVHACFLTTMCTPADKTLWALMAFDRDISINRRNLIMSFYQMCQKKHLYFYGRDRRMLSKNPTFTSMLGSLRLWFPDMTLVICVREPERAVPSQLSSLKPVLNLLGHRQLPTGFQAQMQSGLRHYYDAINHHMQIAHHRRQSAIVVHMSRLKASLSDTVQDVMKLADQPASKALTAAVTEHNERPYRSSHKYNLTDYDLTEDDIARYFGAVWPLVIPEDDDVPTGGIAHV